MHIRLIISGMALIGLAACSVTTQTTSGRDYIARYNETHAQPVAETAASGVDADVREIANIEPTLTFPARIGLARIERGRLAPIPADEALIWTQLGEDLGGAYGSFVPISPLIASTVKRPNPDAMDAAGAVVADIRRGAARQHVDYVVAYEVSSRRQDKANALALADLSVIGMFVLPSRTIEIEAAASALMIDVRTGYPYATLTTYAEKSGLSRVVSGQSTTQSYIDTAEERAVAKLADAFEAALEQLAEAADDRS